MAMACGASLMAGCKACPTELRGKTSFGPEFRNRGNNTHEIRYDARQALELKWDNGWTTGLNYRRRDVDEGSGDSENRVMLEVGYPLWKRKKADKTAERIQNLEHQVEEMQARIAEARGLRVQSQPELAQAASTGERPAGN